VILADENIDKVLIDHLRLNGFEVISIFEQYRGVSDERIIEISKNPPRIILTEDKDFGEWIYSHHEKNISVILLRYDFTETNKILRILLQTLKERNNNLWGAFTTITSNKIRIRKIEN
jgi:predicted nuclease of predicted toxin-antitoxin system